MAQRTLVIIKPDGMQRLLAGEIICRFEKKGFKLAAAKFMHISRDLARRLYTVHKGKPFFEKTVNCLSSAPSLVMVWQGARVIETSRKMIGATFGYEAEPGTIRGDFSCSERYNLVHGSDSPETAEQEIALFFKPEEIIEYALDDARWLSGPND